MNTQIAGVYRITNKQNGRFYIGSTKNFDERFKHHQKMLRKGKHCNSFLQSDYNKCGDVFEYEVLQVVEDKEKRFSLEQVYLNKFFDKQVQCYNLRSVACWVPNQSHSKTSREKISAVSKKVWNDPVGRASLLQAQEKARLDPEYKSKKQAGINKVWNDPEKRALMIQKKKDVWNQPGYKEAVREKRKKKWEDPQFKEQNREMLERLHKANSASAATYILQSPEGKVVEVKNLSSWCKENGYDSKNFYKMSSGSQKSSYDWTMLEKFKPQK